MSGAQDLARLVPGFDFLQGLMKNAGAGLPAMGQWIAPTLNPEELDKRIQELKTVQFWLEQNARLLGTTIQALEVQRMTLSTLQTMNLPLADLAESLKLKTPAPVSPPAPEPAPAAPPARRASRPRAAAKTATPAGAKGGGSKTAPAAVDPMQWWGALTQQFTELAAQAVKDSAAEGAKGLAGTLVRQGVDSAAGALKAATRTGAAAAGAVKRAAAPARGRK